MYNWQRQFNSHFSFVNIVKWSRFNVLCLNIVLKLLSIYSLSLCISLIRFSPLFLSISLILHFFPSSKRWHNIFFLQKKGKKRFNTSQTSSMDFQSHLGTTLRAIATKKGGTPQRVPQKPLMAINELMLSNYRRLNFVFKFQSTNLTQ